MGRLGRGGRSVQVELSRFPGQIDMRRPTTALDEVPNRVLRKREHGLEALKRRLAPWDKVGMERRS